MPHAQSRAGEVYSHLKSRLRPLRIARQSPLNWYAIRAQARTGRGFLHEPLRAFLQCDDAWLSETAAEYAACRPAWRLLSGLRSRSRATDGYALSLDVAEGFALWALVKHVRPRVVVELGSQYGISARLWKEALKAYVPGHELILCDLVDRRLFIDDRECTFLREDARQSLPRLFETRQVDLLHNDAHPYDLITWSVTEAVQRHVPVLTFHDVGGRELRGGPFKVEGARLSTAEKLRFNLDYETYGCWERHVMAEIFDARILDRDQVSAKGWRLAVFDSFLGVGVALRTADQSNTD